MTLAQRIWSALGALAMTALAIVGLAGWWRERSRRIEVGKDTLDLAGDAVKLEREKAEADARAAQAAAHAKVQAEQDAAKKRVDDADDTDALGHL